MFAGRLHPKKSSMFLYRNGASLSNLSGIVFTPIGIGAHNNSIVKGGEDGGKMRGPFVNAAN